jgi:hypothetical protein
MAKETKEKLVPMPPVGWPVQFFERGNQKRPYAGVIDLHNQDPGQCRVIYHAGTMSRVSDNATYAPLVEGRPVTATVLSFGTWSYLSGQKIPDEHYEFHMRRLDDLEKQAAIRKASEEDVKRSYEAGLKESGASQMAAVAVQRAAAVMAQRA